MIIRQCWKLLALVVLTLCGSSANAAPILVGTWDFTGRGSEAEAVFVTTAIGSYNSTHEPDLPLLSEMASLVTQGEIDPYITGGEDHVLTWTAAGGFDFYYVLSKYGQGNADFDSALHYVLPGEILNYNPGGSLAPNGLSHVSIWGGREQVTNVPDGGSILAMLGVSVTAFAIMRMKRF